MSFTIDTWSANSVGINTDTSWKEWSLSLQWPESDSIDVDLIPAMMRRRMSKLSKLAVQTAIQLLKEADIDYLVFSSRHGELHRSAELIKEIIQGAEPSPMSFSQSVHNTAAGLSTIATKKALPVTSIAAGENSFQSALTEAWIYLQEFPNNKVLLIDFDQPLPADYAEFEQKAFKGYALGLVLSTGNTWQVAQTTKSDTIDALPQALSFLSHYLRNDTQWTIHGERTSWEWQRA